jgi:choline transport protein
VFSGAISSSGLVRFPSTPSCPNCLRWHLPQVDSISTRKLFYIDRFRLLTVRSWVAMLAPPSSRKFLSYITGWVTLIGWQATTASSAYLAGTILQSVILILHDDYSPKPYQAMLLGWAVTVFAVVINTVGSKTLAHFEGVILILHIMGFFAILIPLVYLAPHSDASIFTTFVNTGGWPTQGLSFMVGLPSSVFALVGTYDKIPDLAEEEHGY